MQEIYWSSAISQLQEKQKREYKEWVLNVHEQNTADISVLDAKEPTPLSRTTRSPSLESYVTGAYDTLSPQDALMEESFTIHLGNYLIRSCFMFHFVSK